MTTIQYITHEAQIPREDEENAWMAYRRKSMRMKGERKSEGRCA
jgi:hypothetical protein